MRPAEYLDTEAGVVFSRAEQRLVHRLWAEIGVVATADLLGSTVRTIDGLTCSGGWVRQSTADRVRVRLAAAMPSLGGDA